MSRLPANLGKQPFFKKEGDLSHEYGFTSFFPGNKGAIHRKPFFARPAGHPRIAKGRGGDISEQEANANEEQVVQQRIKEEKGFLKAGTTNSTAQPERITDPGKRVEETMENPTQGSNASRSINRARVYKPMISLRQGPALVQREEEGESEPQPEPAPSLLTLPGTDLTLIPGPVSPSLLGARFPLPASLRLTNALGAGSGQTFVLDLSPRRVVLNLLETINLHTWTRPGTPPQGLIDPQNQAHISLINPRLTLNPTTGKLRGQAVLSIDSDYPEGYGGPTELDVYIESTQIGEFSGRLRSSVLSANFNLKMHYDTGRLVEALSNPLRDGGGIERSWHKLQAIVRDTLPNVRFNSISGALQSLLRTFLAGDVDASAFVSQTLDLVKETVSNRANLDSLETALRRLAEEITHPGFTLSGTGGLNIPLLGHLPLTPFRLRAPTTLALDRKLPGAMMPFPYSFSAGGAIVAPPGSISKTAVPAFGGTYSSFGERSGFSVTGALLPTISTEAIGTGEPFLNRFPVLAYLEISYVRRVSEGLDLGARLTVQTSTPEIFGTPSQERGDENARFDRIMQDMQSLRDPTKADETITPTVGLVVFGEF